MIVVKPYAMSACALFIIGMTTRRRVAAGVTGGSGIGAGAGVRQPPNTRAATSSTRDALTSPTTTAVSSLGAKRSACSRSSRSRVRPSTISIDPFVAPAVRMPARVQQRHQRLGRADRRVVLVLPDRRDHLALARRDLSSSGQRRRHEDVAEQREHRLEIVGETRADQGEQMPGDGDRQGDAAAVELLRDVRRRARGGAAIDDTRESSHVAPGRPADRRPSRRASRG